MVITLIIESLHITITLTGGALKFFWQSGVQTLLALLGIEPTSNGLSVQSGAFDHTDKATFVEGLLKNKI